MVESAEKPMQFISGGSRCKSVYGMCNSGASCFCAHVNIMLSLHKPVNFKVIVSRDECFLKVCNNIHSVHALIVFKMFCFLVDEKI